MEATRNQVRQYILQNYLFTEDESALSDEVSFLDSGLIDSTGMMEVIFFLEEAFSIKVEDEEMVPENLDSVNNLLHYIQKKSGKAA
ncbi:MAG: acyl carrier protein [Alcanivoracaceae bacterium]|nr:acyl carrier protein [Alcanivoracaceae bacterium]